MKKVILLSGSPNPEGNTVQVFRECAKVIEENGVETEIITLSGMNLKDSMNFQGGYNDGFDEVIEKIRNAQGFIVGGSVLLGNG